MRIHAYNQPRPAAKAAAVFLAVSIALGGIEPAPYRALYAAEQRAVLPMSPDWRLPESLGRAEHRFAGAYEGKPWVVILQDAHSLGPAQEKLFSIVNHIEDTVPLHAVGFEGAEGRLDFTLLASYPEPEDLRKILLELTREGEISGAAAAAAIPASDAVFLGVEDGPLYRTQIENFFGAARAQGEVQTALGRLAGSLRGLKEKYYPAELLFFDRLASEVPMPAENIRRILSLLADAGLLSGYPALAALHAAFMEEAKSHQGADQRLEEFFKAAEAVSSKEETQTLQRIKQDYRTGLSDFYSAAYELQKWNTERKSVIPFPPPLTDAAALGRKLRAYGNFAGEWDAAARNFTARAAGRSGNAHAAARLSRRFEILNSFSRLELTRTQWEEFKKEAGGDEIFDTASSADLRAFSAALGKIRSGYFPGGSPFKDFYETAEKREKYFLEKLPMSPGRVSVLVSGGFHAEDLSAQLTARNIPHTVITPAIKEVPESRYAEHMRGRVSWLASFSGGKEISPYETFHRWIIARLTSENEAERERLLYLWRSALLRRLADKGGTAGAGRYLRLLETGGNSGSENPDLGFVPLDLRLNRFLKELTSLRAKGSLDEKNLSSLFYKYTAAAWPAVQWAAPANRARREWIEPEETFHLEASEWKRDLQRRLESGLRVDLESPRPDSDESGLESGFQLDVESPRPDSDESGPKSDSEIDFQNLGPIANALGLESGFQLDVESPGRAELRTEVSIPVLTAPHKDIPGILARELLASYNAYPEHELFWLEQNQMPGEPNGRREIYTVMAPGKDELRIAAVPGLVPDGNGGVTPVAHRIIEGHFPPGSTLISGFIAVRPNGAVDLSAALNGTGNGSNRQIMLAHLLLFLAIHREAFKHKIMKDAGFAPERQLHLSQSVVSEFKNAGWIEEPSAPKILLDEFFSLLKPEYRGLARVTPNLSFREWFERRIFNPVRGFFVSAWETWLDARYLWRVYVIRRLVRSRVKKAESILAGLERHGVDYGTQRFYKNLSDFDINLMFLEIDLAYFLKTLLKLSREPRKNSWIKHSWTGDFYLSVSHEARLISRRGLAYKAANLLFEAGRAGKYPNQSWTARAAADVRREKMIAHLNRAWMDFVPSVRVRFGSSADLYIPGDAAEAIRNVIRALGPALKRKKHEKISTENQLDFTSEGKKEGAEMLGVLFTIHGLPLSHRELDKLLQRAGLKKEHRVRDEAGETIYKIPSGKGASESLTVGHKEFMPGISSLSFYAPSQEADRERLMAEALKETSDGSKIVILMSSLSALNAFQGDPSGDELREILAFNAEMTAWNISRRYKDAAFFAARALLKSARETLLDSDHYGRVFRLLTAIKDIDERQEILGLLLEEYLELPLAITDRALFIKHLEEERRYRTIFGGLFRLGALSASDIEVFARHLPREKAARVLHLLAPVLHGMSDSGRGDERLDLEDSLIDYALLPDEKENGNTQPVYLNPKAPDMELSPRRKIRVFPARMRAVPYYASRLQEEIIEKPQLLAVFLDERLQQEIKHLRLDNHVLDSLIYVRYYVREIGGKKILLAGEIQNDSFRKMKSDPRLRHLFGDWARIMRAALEYHAQRIGAGVLAIPHSGLVEERWRRTDETGRVAGRISSDLARIVYDDRMEEDGYALQEVPWKWEKNAQGNWWIKEIKDGDEMRNIEALFGEAPANSDAWKSESDAQWKAAAQKRNGDFETLRDSIAEHVRPLVELSEKKDEAYVLLASFLAEFRGQAASITLDGFTDFAKKSEKGKQIEDLIYRGIQGRTEAFLVRSALALHDDFPDLAGYAPAGLLHQFIADAFPGAEPGRISVLSVLRKLNALAAKKNGKGIPFGTQTKLRAVLEGAARYAGLPADLERAAEISAEFSLWEYLRKSARKTRKLEDTLIGAQAGEKPLGRSELRAAPARDTSEVSAVTAAAGVLSSFKRRVLPDAEILRILAAMNDKRFAVFTGLIMRAAETEASGPVLDAKAAEMTGASLAAMSASTDSEKTAYALAFYSSSSAADKQIIRYLEAVEEMRKKTGSRVQGRFLLAASSSELADPERAPFFQAARRTRGVTLIPYDGSLKVSLRRFFDGPGRSAFAFGFHESDMPENERHRLITNESGLEPAVVFPVVLELHRAAARLNKLTPELVRKLPQETGLSFISFQREGLVIGRTFKQWLLEAEASELIGSMA